MCDCFHLAFPNWHGSPGTGAGRRLKGPEPEDDSVCEDPPEFIEGERPRPQGSSPVNEYPATEKYTDLDKEREEEADDPYLKSGGKKGKKVGFGSFFEKRPKMSQEECPESGAIVKTAKEVCAEGLVVTGGAQEGIFVKEVKAESAAAKHLSAHEGDQILSATVYFDNVSYEDALQILEHAQPYKMDLCLKRKPPAVSDLESSTAERQEVAPGEEGGPLERGRTKTQRRQDARISWPKFPSFTRGRKAHFKRSHSTSEAEEQRKLEMSPTTSDTESPMKSLEPGKDKKTKKQKLKLSKLKMKGVKSKSVEQQDKDSTVPVSRSLENVQPQQTEHVLDTHSPPPQESILGETPQLIEMDQQEKKETTKTRNEYHFPDISGSFIETSQHRTELISLDKTLKTTDISDFLAGSLSTKKSPDKKKKKKERSELKMNMQGKEKEDSTPEGLLKSPQALILKTSSDSLKTPDMGARTQDLSKTIVGSNAKSQTELKESPISIDIKTERFDPNKSIPKEEKESSTVMGDVDICLPKVDMSLDMSDVGLLKKSPRIKSEKQKRERSILILDSERYGIRPRGPVADISMTKKGLGKGSLLDSGLDISKPKSPKMKTSFPGTKGQAITATGKDASIKMETVVDIKSPQLEIQASKSPKMTRIGDDTEKIGTKTVQKFKIPKVGVPEFNVHESIVKTELDTKAKVDVKGPKVQDKMHKKELDSRQHSPVKQVDIKIELLKREDIVIPGMEATALAGNLQTTGFKLPETGKIDVEIHAEKIKADMKVDEMKDTTSKTDLHTFKLPKLDMSSLDVHKQITKSNLTDEKVKLDLTTDVSKTPAIEVKGQDLRIQAADHSTEIGINYINGEMIRRIVPTPKIPKIDSPDPNAHEPISMTQVSTSKTKVEIHGAAKIEGKSPMDGGVLEISSSHSEMDKIERPELKLPKREDIEIPGMESISTAGNIQTVDIQLPGIRKKDASDPSVEIQAKQIHPQIVSNINLPTFKLPSCSDFDVHEHITKIDVNTEKSKSPKQLKKDQTFHAEGTKGKFKIPPVPECDVSFPNIKSDVKLTKELGEERETGEIKCVADTEIQIAARTDIHADFKKKSKVSMPTLGITKPDIRFPEAGVQISLPKGKDEDKLVISKETNYTLQKPNTEMPSMDISKPDIKVSQLSGDITLSSFSRSEISNIKYQVKTAEIDVSLPKGGVIKSTDVDMTVPETTAKITCVAGSPTKLKLPASKMPQFGIKSPKVPENIPDVTAVVKMPELSPKMIIKSTQVKTESTILVSKTKMDIKTPEVAIKSPSLEINADLLESGETKGKFQMPHMKIPSLGISKSEVKDSKSDADISISKPENVEKESEENRFKLPKFDITLPKVKGPAVDIDTSNVDIPLSEAALPIAKFEGASIEGKVEITDTDSKGFSVKIKKPEISLPEFGFSKPEITVPEVKTPSLKVGLDTGVSDIPTDRSLEVDKPTGKTELLKMKLPDIDVSLQDQEVNLKKQFETDVSSLDNVTAEIPEVESGGKAKFEIPHIKIPSFGILKLEGKGPETSLSGTSVDFDTQESILSGKIPAADIKGPCMDAGSDIDIDVKDKDEELSQGSKFKLPKFGISLPKLKGTGVDISTSKPDVDISLPEVTVEAQLPSVEIEGPVVEGTLDIPEVDSKEGDLKFKKPSISFPKFGFTKSEDKAPEMEVNIPEEGISVPEKGDVTGPEIETSDIDANVDTDIGASASKFKLPAFKLPKIGVTVPAVKANFPEVRAEITEPEIKAEVEVDIDQVHEIENQGGIQLPKVKLPQVKLPQIDLSLSKSKELQLHQEIPKAEAELSVPETDVVKEFTVEGPSLDRQAEIPDIETAGHGKFKMPHIKLPSFGFSKPEITGPKFSGDVNVPSVDIAVTKPKADISAPDISADVTSVGMKLQKPPEAEIKDYSIDLEGPDVNADMKVKGFELEGQESKFKLPKFGISLPKVKGPAVDISVSKSDVDIKLPELPDVAVEGPSVEGNIDVKGADITVKKPKVSLPKFGFSKPDVKTPDINIGFPKGDISLEGGSVKVKEPGMNITAPDIGDKEDSDFRGSPSKFEVPTFKLPKFGITAPKVKAEAPDLSVNITVPETETPSDMSYEIPKAEYKISVPGTDVVLQDVKVDLKGSSLDGQAEIPDIEAGAGEHGRFKMPHIKLPSFGFSKPEITAPKISGNLPSVDIAVTKPNVDINVPDITADVPSAGMKLPEADVAVSGEMPAVDIKDYNVDVEGPDVDIDMKGKGTELDGQGMKFKLPKFGISFPKAKGPAVDISVSKPDVDISLPEVTAEAKLPGVEVEGPSVEGTVNIPEADSKEFDMKFKKPNISFPKFGFSKPEITGPKISGSLNLPSVDIAGTKPSVDITVPDISADVTTADVKLPEADLTVSGERPAVDIKDYNVDLEGPDVDIDIKGKGAGLEGQGGRFKLPKFGISFPKAKGPAVDISASKPDVDISLPEVTAEAELPGVDGPSVEGTIDIPEMDSKDFDVKLKKPKISFPKFGFSKHEITAPKISGDLNLPSVDIAVTKPNADITVPDISADIPSADVKLPGADLTVSGEIHAVDIKDYNVDVEGPDVDIDMKGKGTELDGQGMKFKLPKFGISFPKAKGPALDISVSKPDVDISLPEATAEAKLPGVEVKGPSVEGIVNIPEADSKEFDLKFKKPNISFPKFGFSKPEITAPKISGSLNLPSVDIAGTKPSVDITVPDISADVTTADVKLPEADLTVSGEMPAVDIKGYNVDVEGPEVDIDIKGTGTGLEGQGGRFKLPKFGISFPKAKGPAVDISVSKPDVDISLPEVTAEAKLPAVEVEGPSVEGTVVIPEVDSTDIDVKLKKSKISFPKFGFSKPDVTAPGIDISLPKGDISLSGGSVEVKEPGIDIKAPDVGDKEDSNIKGSPSKFKVPTFKLPTFGITTSKVKAEAPDLSVNITVPETEAPSAKAVIDHEGTVMETGKAEGKFHLPTMKIPSIDVNVPTLKGPDMSQGIPKAEYEISGPDTVKVDLKGSSLDGQAEIPDIEAGAGEHGRFKMPHIKLPSFGFSKPEITAPKLSGNLPSVDITVTKPNADINVPDISADVPSAGMKLPEADVAVSGEIPEVDIKDYSVAVEGPDVDIDMKGKGTELDGQGMKFKLPKFGISFPKAKGPAVDISVSKPDVDISLPEVTAEAKLPAVEVEGPSVEGTVVIPEVDSKEFDLKLKRPKVSFPKFGFSKPDVTAPEIDISLPKKDISLSGGSVEVKEPGIDIKAPDIDDKEDANIKGSPSKFKVPTFKLPKFGITGPKVKAEAPDLSVNITVPETETPSDMSYEIPKAEYKISVPGTDVVLQDVKVDLKGSSLDGQAEIPDIEAGAGEHGRFKMPHIKLPSFGFSKPEITAPKISGNLPSVDIAVTKPNVDINVPDISADVPSAGMKLPEADVAVSGEMPAVDIKDYNVDVEGPDVDIDMKGKGTELDGQGMKFKLPKFGISFPKAKGPAVDISVSKPDVDISLPEVTAEAKLPGVEVEGPSVEGTVNIPEVDSKEVDLKMKKPRISFPKFGFSKPDVKAPEIDVNLPKGEIPLTEGSVEVKGPEVDIKAPDTEIEIKDKDMEIVGSPTKFKLPTIKFPKFGISAPKITTESPDIKTGIKLPEMETSEKVNVDIEAPRVDIDVSLPKVKGSIKTPDIDINLPEVDMSLPESKVDGKGSGVPIKTQDTEANVDVNIGGSPSKFKLPTFKLPKFGSKVKAEIPEVSAESTEPKKESLSGKVEVKHAGQGIDIEKPVGKFELPKVKMPDISFSLPKAKGIEIHQEVPKAESNISVPETDTVLQETKLEVKGMHIDGQAEIPSIEAGAGEQGKFKMPHIKIPSFGFSRPEITGPKISGDVHLPSVDIAVTKPNADITVPDISADVTSADVKLPEADLAISGEIPAVDVKDYNVDVKGPDVDIDMKGKGTELDGQGSKFKLPKFGISFTKTKGPAADISVSKPDIDVSLPEVTVETKLPGVDIEGPSVEVDSKGVGVKGEGELDVKVKKSKISFPKFGFSKPEGKAPEPEVILPKGEISLTEGSVEVKGPEVDIKAPETEIEIKDKDMDIIGSPTKFKLPTIKFPKFGISAPKITAEPSNAEIDITVPELETSGQLKVDVGAPRFDIEKSSVDLDKTKGKNEMLKMEMPGIDVSLPKVEGLGSASVDVDSPSFNADMKGAEPEGQGSRFKLPKFGISFQKAKGPGADISASKPDVDISSPEVKVELPSVEIEGPSIEGRVDVPDVDSKEVDLKVKKPRISFPKFGFSKPDVKVPEIDVNFPKGEISLTEGSVEVKGPEVDIKAPDTEIEIKDTDTVVSPSKFKLPTFKFPKFGSPKSKVEAQEESADITSPEINAPLGKTEVDVGVPDFENDVLSIEIEKSEGTVKLPKLKMTSIDMSLPKGQRPESKPEDEMSAVLPQVKPDVSELEATGTALEAKVDISDPEPHKLEVETKGSPSKFKLPTFKMPKFGFSTAKVKTTDTDVDPALKTSDVTNEGATKEIEESIDDGPSNVTDKDKKTGDAEGQPKSSKLSLSSIGDVFKGFDVEFNVPKLEEVEESLASPGGDVAHSVETHTTAEKDSTMKYQSHTDPSQIQLSTSHHAAEVSVQAPTITKEAEAKDRSKFKFRFPRLGFTESSEQDDKTESIKLNVEEKEKPLEPQEDKEKEDMKEKEENTDKGSWFKFKFGITSPSKTIKDSEKGTSQPNEGIDKSTEGDIEEEDASLTSSVRSSDAFADISSTVMSEQPGPLVVSPTKVKVKISEPPAMVGVSEVKVPTDIITSTARTELILLEHHLPEKVETVTIPVSSEATLTSPDELTQDTGGDIHVVTSNIQATPSSEHATVITKYETRSVHQAMSMQKMTVKVGSAHWAVEESGEGSGESSEENVLVEKHMVKETSGDDKGAVIMSQRVTQIVGTTSGEPILEDTASALRKLRDTMHSEKMRFFEGAETSTVTVSTQKIEKHVFESSTEKESV